MSIPTRTEGRMLDLLNLCNVPRWSIVPRRQEQSVAEHSFRVAIIAQELAALLDPSIKHGEVVLHSLLHDVQESYTGDLPKTYKRDYGAPPMVGYCGWLKEYPFEDRVRRIVKLADTMEAIDWIRHHGASPSRTHPITLDLEHMLYAGVTPEEHKAIKAIFRLLELQ